MFTSKLEVIFLKNLKTQHWSFPMNNTYLEFAGYTDPARESCAVGRFSSCMKRRETNIFL